MAGNALECLLSRRFIIKAREKELYYQIKDELPSLQNFLIEKLGYQVIVNPYMIKVEKIPASPKNWMGIMEFKEKEDYILFCYVLMFLEDKENEEQFVLSSLTESIAAQCVEFPVDWTNFGQRRSLIRVMKYCEQTGLLLVNDGAEENFTKDIQTEVLYENTGISRYMTRNFIKDISMFQKPSDFQAMEWIDVDEDRGMARRHRVYRTLLMTPGMLLTENEEDALYVRNYRNVIQKDFERYFDCELQLHRSSAFLMLGEDCRLGRRIPEEASISDLSLLCCRILREKLCSGDYHLPENEQAIISMPQLLSCMEEVKNRYEKGMIKRYREMTTGEFTRELLEYMQEIGLVEIREQKAWLHPGMGKMTGRFPKDWEKEECQ